jgi:hypothetical protein
VPDLDDLGDRGINEIPANITELVEDLPEQVI